jgi:hypothetical protein
MYFMRCMYYVIDKTNEKIFSSCCQHGRVAPCSVFLPFFKLLQASSSTTALQPHRREMTQGSQLIAIDRNVPQ